MADDHKKTEDNASDKSEELTTDTSAQDAADIPGPDMSGEVMDPVFDDTMPLKPSSDYMPDPHFEDSYTKPQKRALNESEMQELSATLPQGVNLSDEDQTPLTDPREHVSTAQRDTPKNPFYQEEGSEDEQDIPQLSDAADKDEDDASTSSRGGLSQDADTPDNTQAAPAADEAGKEDNIAPRPNLHQADAKSIMPDPDDAPAPSEDTQATPAAAAPPQDGYDVSDGFSSADPDIEVDKLKKGEDSYLSVKDPTLRKLHVGCGWDMDHFDGEPLDLDLSCFILNKEDMTRVDSDFVFYNNLKGADLAVQHSGDNRTGMGEGDDEVITVDLEALPFEVWKIVFVVTIYMGEEESLNFSHVQNAFIRMMNGESKQELARFDLSNDFGDGTCLRFGEITREGSEWRFHADGSFEKGGLAKIAQEYGLLISGT